MARRLCIRGHVQGVGFRYALMEQAERLGLSGWVRNCRDGTVEAVADGTPDAVEALIRWAHRGPPSAVVSAVNVDEDSGHYDTFEMRT